MSFRELQLTSSCSLMNCNFFLSATRSVFNPLPSRRNNCINLFKDLTASELCKPQRIREAFLENRECFPNLPLMNLNAGISMKNVSKIISASFSMTVSAFFNWKSSDSIDQPGNSTIREKLQNDLTVAKQELEYWTAGHSKLMAFLQSDLKLCE